MKDERRQDPCRRLAVQLPRNQDAPRGISRAGMDGYDAEPAEAARQARQQPHQRLRPVNQREASTGLEAARRHARPALEMVWTHGMGSLAPPIRRGPVRSGLVIGRVGDHEVSKAGFETRRPLGCGACLDIDLVNRRTLFQPVEGEIGAGESRQARFALDEAGGSCDAELQQAKPDSACLLYTSDAADE